MTLDLKDVCLSEDATLEEALQRLNVKHVDTLCVVDREGKIVGTLTDGDVRRAFLRGFGLTTTAVDVCNRKPTLVAEDATAGDIDRLLNLASTHGVRSIPKVAANGEVLGLISRRFPGIVPMASPDLAGQEIRYVLESLNTGWISSSSPFVPRFEAALAEFLEMPQVLAVANGTVALVLALAAHGIGPGDEVLVPDITFAATANAVIHVGATPVLIDIDPETWGFDKQSLSEAVSENTRAAIPVHLYGLPTLDYEILHFFEAHKIVVVEDCAEALGTRQQQRHVGSQGAACTFSFFANKTLTTGEGGAVRFQDQKMYEHAKTLRDHGMSSNRKYWHDVVGFNFRLTGMQAAVGCAQLERLDSFLERKQWIADQYLAAIGTNTSYTIKVENANGASSHWVSPMVYDLQSIASDRNPLEFFRTRGIEIRPIFFPLHTMTPYKDFKHFSISNWATRIHQNGFCLPNFPSMSDAAVEQVCSALQDWVTDE